MNPIHRTVDRRSMLTWAGGTALVTASLSGCSFLSTDPQQQSGDATAGAADSSAKESPMLTKQVEAGELPPLEERLPAEPLVVEAPEAGRFGGTWTSVFLGPGDEGAIERILGFQPLLRKDVMCVETVPSLCTDIEVSDDGTEFTLRLRPGVRWSDGEPFVADDIVFTMEEVLGNTELYPVPPAWLSHDDEPAKIEKIDETTVTITFPESNGTFRESAAREMALVECPQHYLSQFLPAHNEQLDSESEEAGFETWTDYFWEKSSRMLNVDLPVLLAWKVTEPLGESNRVLLQRNPYFWKTDADGRQLPYIDTLSFEVVQDPQVMVLKGSAGELDMVNRLVNTAANKPVFAKGREPGEYGMVDTVPARMNTMCIGLNLANRDKEHRDLYQKKDFRVGLSHAIDRDELITAVWQRQGEPWQAAPTADSIYYDEELAKQYTEYDPDTANEHLDRAGLTDRDGKGFRKLPSGKPLTITLDLATAVSAEWAAAGDMIKSMWGEVGVRLNLNTVDRTIFVERKTASANKHDAAVWLGDGGLTDEVIDPRWYMPFSDESLWATPWGQWYSSGGKEGTEPIGPAKEQIELFWELERTPEQAAREELFRQILAIAKDQFWVIGISTMPAPYMIVKNRLKNVIGDIPDTWVYRTPAHANPEAWYLDPARG